MIGYVYKQNSNGESTHVDTIHCNTEEELQGRVVECMDKHIQEGEDAVLVIIHPPATTH